MNGVIRTRSIHFSLGTHQLTKRGGRPNDVCANQTSISKYASRYGVPKLLRDKQDRRIRDKEGNMMKGLASRLGANYRTKCGVCL